MINLVSNATRFFTGHADALKVMRAIASLGDLMNTINALGDHLQDDQEDKPGHATLTHLHNNKTKHITKQRGSAWKVVNGMNQDYQQLLARPETVTETKIIKNEIVVKQQAVAQDQNAMLSRWFQEMATRQLIKDCEAEMFALRNAKRCTA